jgi:hypothetical protein
MQMCLPASQLIVSQLLILKLGGILGILVCMNLECIYGIEPSIRKD